MLAGVAVEGVRQFVGACRKVDVSDAADGVVDVDVVVIIVVFEVGVIIYCFRIHDRRSFLFWRIYLCGNSCKSWINLENKKYILIYRRISEWRPLYCWFSWRSFCFQCDRNKPVAWMVRKDTRKWREMSGEHFRWNQTMEETSKRKGGVRQHFLDELKGCLGRKNVEWTNCQWCHSRERSWVVKCFCWNRENFSWLKWDCFVRESGRAVY